MKTIMFIRHTMQAAAVAFLVATLSAGVISCKDEDGADPNSRLAAGLVGTWFGSYSQTGTLTTDNGQEASYIKAVQALTFNSDGTGTCWKFLCDIMGQPVSLYGGAGDALNGRFHYTVGKDSVITITRDGDGNGGNPKTWQLSVGTQALTGADGSAGYQLLAADSDWRDYIASMEADFRSGSNANDDEPNFLTDWQNVKTVRIEGLADKQYTPWAGSGDSDISDEIRFDVQKEAGWEMAFCALNDPSSKNTRFFALYNRFTGTLRVFNYILNPGSQGYGKEMGYMFHADGDVRMPRYPFYNSMEYAIPICHNYADDNTFDRTVILSTNGSSYRPFETMSSAYTRNTEAIGVSAGWHCTDFDFSGYHGNGVHWTEHALAEGTLLSVRPYSQDESKVLLTGSIIGTLDGEFHDPSYKTKSTGNPTLSAISGVVSTLAGTASTGFNSFNQAYSMHTATSKLLQENAAGVLSSQAINTLFCGAGVLQIAACGLKIADQFVGGGKETVEASPGTINMTFDAKVDLSGTIKSWKTVDDAGVRVTPNLLKASNEGSESVWMGTGCYGLAEDPVICISKEDLLTVSNSIAISKNGENYTAPSFAKDSVRLLSFLDPRTVKLCLNTDVYHDISDVNVVINYGINANRPVGNTDCYRQMLKLDARPTFTIMPTSGNKLTVTTTPRLHVMKKLSVIKNDFYAVNYLDSVKLDYQKGSVLPLYGHFESFCGKRFVMDPQVFIPFDPESTTVYPVEIPDFVVSVSVSFKCKECPDGVIFSKLYIPKVKLIGHKDLATYYNDLKDYSDKCINNQPIGTLYNNNAINVYSKCGDMMLAKTLDILNKCK